MIVADTHVIAYLLVEGGRTAAACAVRARDPVWRVPPCWRAEFLDVLATTVRAGTLTPREAFGAWGAAARLARGAEVDPGEEQVLRTALEHGLTAYGAGFVALADALDVPLVTADRRLTRARPDRAVLLEDFAG